MHYMSFDAAWQLRKDRRRRLRDAVLDGSTAPPAAAPARGRPPPTPLHGRAAAGCLAAGRQPDQTGRPRRTPSASASTAAVSPAAAGIATGSRGGSAGGAGGGPRAPSRAASRSASGSARASGRGDRDGGTPRAPAGEQVGFDRQLVGQHEQGRQHVLAEGAPRRRGVGARAGGGDLVPIGHQLDEVRCSLERRRHAATWSSVT